MISNNPGSVYQGIPLHLTGINSGDQKFEVSEEIDPTRAVQWTRLGEWTKCYEKDFVAHGIVDKNIKVVFRGSSGTDE